jgi:hypothetical protein
MKWLFTLLWSPKVALDWHDQKGTGYDHAKVLVDCLLFAFTGILGYVAIQTKTFPPMGWGIVMIAGAFGSRMFMAFLRSKTP